MRINGIDEKDNVIIDLLQKDARMTYSDIAEEIGLTRTAVKNRVRSLEERGIISGYRAIINPQNSPEMMTFVVNIETKPEIFDEVKKILCDAPETVTLAQTTGHCRLVAICVSEDAKKMQTFLNRMYNTVNGITYISANTVLDVMKGSVIP